MLGGDGRAAPADIKRQKRFKRESRQKIWIKHVAGTFHHTSRTLSFHFCSFRIRLLEHTYTRMKSYEKWKGRGRGEFDLAKEYPFK